MLPYFGGPSVDAPSRRLRVAGDVEPGWWRFEVKGRVATPKQKLEAGDLTDLPVIRGHMMSGWLVTAGAKCERVNFLPEEQPAELAPCRACRWHSGDLVFDQLELEGEAEADARRALEEEGSLREVKGVPASLRAAFGFALIAAASRRLNIPASPLEVKHRLLAISEGGRAGAEDALRALVAEREAWARAQDERRRHLEAQLAREAVEEERQRRRDAASRAAIDLNERVREVLDAAGARLIHSRVLGGGLLEVGWSFQGERFISVVESAALQVIDAGICLGHPGQDRKLTLDSLPAVVREAIETQALVITRHG